MGIFIDGIEIAKKIRENVSERVKRLKQEKNLVPKLAVVLVGEDRPSQTYVRKKGEAAEEVGIQFSLYTLPADSKKEDIISRIHEIQQDEAISGLIVQLPLPDPKHTGDVLNAVRPEIDIDCLTDINLGKLVMKTGDIVPPTPGAVMSILKELHINLVGKNVTIIGVGPLVGKPLAIMMLNAHASVTTCDSCTRDIKEKCLQADIIVTGVGQKNILRGDMIREGSVVIDTGICFEHDKMYGDVNVEEVIRKAAFLTPTPGGVGPITVARLLENTVFFAEKKAYDKQCSIIFNRLEDKENENIF